MHSAKRRVNDDSRGEEEEEEEEGEEGMLRNQRQGPKGTAPCVNECVSRFLKGKKAFKVQLRVKIMNKIELESEKGFNLQAKTCSRSNRRKLPLSKGRSHTSINPSVRLC